MKKILSICFSFFILHCSFAGGAAACACGVARERENDFYWENDVFGMRAYGPGEFHRWSGLDVYNKDSRQGGSVKELLSHPGKCGNWHLVPWKGVLDNYAVAAGRGLGGVAIWGDGEWKTYPDWESCEILKNTGDEVDFKLVYPASSCLGKMTYHITLKKGDHFFRNEVTFANTHFRDGFEVGPGFDATEGRGHAGNLFESQELGIVSLYENSRGDVEGSTMSAVILDPKDAKDVVFRTDHLGCRVMAVKKASFTYYAGACWSRNDRVKSAEDWHKLVKNFRKELEK